MSFISRLIQERSNVDEVILPARYGQIFPKNNRVGYCKHGKGISLSRDAALMAVSKQCDVYRGGMSGVVLYRLFDGNYVEESTFMDEEELRSPVYGSGLALTSPGNMLYIGSPESNYTRKNAGIVRAYVNVGGEWGFSGYIEPPSDYKVTSFGAALAVSEDGTRVFVGCPSTKMLKGAVLVYDHTPNGRVLTAIIESDLPDTQEFGKSISCSADGNRLIIGMSKQLSDDFDRPAGVTGLVMIYQFSSERWHQTGQITPRLNERNLSFGSGVALSTSGHTLMVAAPTRSGNFKSKGYVNLYRDTKGEGLYEYKTSLCVHDLPERGRFATSIALAGDTGVLATTISVEASLPVSVREAIRIYR